MFEPGEVVAHYSQDDLIEHLLSALKAAGLENGKLSAEQLAPLDQFHSRGLAATIDLAAASKPVRGAKVLDIGSGLGGPSRYLASNYGCSVTGIDLSPAYVEAATLLTERAGLTNNVTFRCANALSLPFEEAHFDLIWTQHVAMNILDRAGLYAEANRVLKPGGCLAIYDIVLGNVAPLVYPVPWSRGPETSFLMTPDAMLDVLKSQGFIVTSWIDRTASAIDWFDDLREKHNKPFADTNPLGLQIAMGSEFKAMSANLGRNLKEGRALVIEAVFKRP